MNLKTATLTTCLFSLAMAGCQADVAAPAASAPATGAVVEAPEAPALVTDPSVVESNRLVMYVSDPRVMQTEGVGTREGSRLASNGTTGHLMFGPKVSFDAGKYRVTVFGETPKIALENGITFDVTSNNGEQVHAKLDLDASSTFAPNAPIATFDFELPAPATALEVRAYVTSGAEVVLTRYEIAPLTETAAQ